MIYGFGVPVLLPIFIQLRKYDGRRRTSHLCQQTSDAAVVGRDRAQLTRIACHQFIVVATSLRNSGSSKVLAAAIGHCLERLGLQNSLRLPGNICELYPI
jgi:hypothetical protein